MTQQSKDRDEDHIHLPPRHHRRPALQRSDAEVLDQIIADCDRGGPSNGANAEPVGVTLAMVQTVAEILKRMLDHQHSYYGPPDMGGRWLNTGPKRDADDGAHARYMKAHAEKGKP